MKWQQKVFSSTERVYYAQKENCKSELEKRYHQMVKESSDDPESKLIFTYVNDDSYEPADNFGERDVNVTKLRRNVEDRKSVEEEKSSELFVEQSKSIVKSRYAVGDEFVKMFIMADLEPTTLLVSIHYRKSDGVFIIYPDFNSLDNEYLLEIDQNSKQLFGYFVTNLSVSLNQATQQLAQKQKLDKIQEETSELMRKLNLSKDQDFVYPKFCRVVLLMEIIDGIDFEYDNIHIQFHIKLPKFVKVVEGCLNGSTHSSMKNGNVWNFGFCHSLVIDFDDEFLLSTTKLDWITINFEVISIDPTWERERREGIASTKLQLNGEAESSKQIFKVSCYRDLQGGSWLRDFLERFFLGGIHKTTMLDQKQVGISNFYGNQTVSTGSLRLKFQRITQVKPSKRNFANIESIEEVISSYHKAKARLSN